MGIKAKKTLEYSVAQARKDLPSLIKVAEGGTAVAITRRGRPVAVLLSMEAYRHDAMAAPRFSELVAKWRTALADSPNVPATYFDGLRDRSEGREVDVR